MMSEENRTGHGGSAELRRAGYTEESEHSESRIGTYKEGSSYIEARPEPES